MAMGLKAANANYACLWCTVHKDRRYSDFQASCNEKASSVKRQASSVPDYHVSTTAVTALARAHAS